MPKKLSRKTKAKRRRLIIAGLALLMAAGGAALAAEQWLGSGPAAGVYADFAHRLGTTSTLKLSGQLQFAGQQSLAIYNTDATFSGSYDKTIPAKPASDWQFTGLLASKNYNGHIVTSGGEMYVNLVGADPPTIRYNQSETFLYKLVSGQWYRNRHDRTLLGTYCETRSNSHYPDPNFPQQLVAKLKMRQANLVSRGELVNGLPTDHYHAMASGSGMAAAYNFMTQQLPTGCNYTLPGYDLLALPVSYDLWVGDGFDRMKFEFNVQGSHFVLDVTTGSYGEPVAVSTPPRFIDLNKVWPKPKP